MRSTGPLLCLASATAFGAMGIFGKLAYDEGASVATLLATRFVLAAALFWGILACTGGLRGLRALSRRDVGSRSRSEGSATASRRAPTSRRSSASTRRCSAFSSTPSP